jgi:hypothetical protein
VEDGAARYGAAVWELLCPHEERPPEGVERQLEPDSEHRLEEGALQQVTFAGAGGHQLRDRKWAPVTHRQLEALVDAPVDPGRGDGSVPRPAEPKELLVFCALHIQWFRGLTA